MSERKLLLKPAVMALNDLNLYYITAACEAAQNVQSGQDETSLNRKESTAREAAQNVQSGLKTAGTGAPEITLTGNTVIGKGRPIVLVHGNGEDHHLFDTEIRQLAEAGFTVYAIVLVHGNGEDHHLFDTEIRQLAEAGFTVYAPDSRGHGKSTLVSDEPVTEYHYADMAEDIYQFIKALGLKKPALYGHSDGGIIALLLEISHPGTLGIMAASGTNLSPQGLIPSFIEEYSEINKKEEDPLITLMLTEPHIDPESLKKIRIPVLVTAGDNDLILRSETEKIAAALPDSEMVIVEDADHGSYIVDSEVMGKLLLGFLQRRWS